jgi:hypothetical protein
VGKRPLCRLALWIDGEADGPELHLGADGAHRGAAGSP